MNFHKVVESKRLPISFETIIQFYRFFGFSFIEPNNGKNIKLCSKFKNFLMIGYNISMIFSVIAIEILSTTQTERDLEGNSSKPLVRTLFYSNVILAIVDQISGYILALIKGRKLLKLIKTEEVCIIDNNTILAKTLIISKLSIMSLMACIASLVSKNMVWLQRFPLYQRLTALLFGFFTTFLFMIGLFALAVIYSYLTWIITSQINNLKNNISKGNLILKTFLISCLSPHSKDL